MAYEDPTTKTLAELGVTDAAGVARLFADLRNHFPVLFPELWEADRAAWFGRKSGRLTRVADNWLKPAPPELKKAVGQELNALKAHVEQSLESSRRRMESAAGQAAALWVSEGGAHSIARRSGNARRRAVECPS